MTMENAMARVMSKLPILAVFGLLALGAAPTAAQSAGNPFAGRSAGGFGPYGNDTGAALHLMQMGPVMKAGVPIAAAATSTSGITSEESREMPHRAEIPEGTPLWEAMFVGCAAGSFLGGYTAWSTTTSIVGAELAVIGAPGVGYFAATLGTASAIGCGLGASTAAVSIAAASVWAWAFR